MQRVLVTGATGFIGHEVARVLAGLGVPARLVVRRAHRARYVAGLGEVVRADLADERSLRAALEGCDAVLHLGGRATFEPYAVVAPTLVEGTRRLARAARAAGVRAFAHASSTFVYDGRESPVDAATRPAPWSGYGRAKLDAEAAIAAEFGAAAHLRLPHVYGARDAMLRPARGRWPVVSPGRGDNLFSHLHVRDAARALVRAAEVGWTGAAPIADDRPVTWREYMDVLRLALPGLREVRVPRRLARLGARVLHAWAAARGVPTLRTADAVDGYNRALVVRPGSAWDRLGIRPTYPSVHEGLPAALAEAVPGDWLHSIEDSRGASGTRGRPRRA